MDDPALATLMLSEIADLGIHLAIDDFGTGYSSLSYLKQFPLDVLKIDRSFVRDLMIDDDDAAIVDAIMAMSTKLGLEVVAEGVETEAQLDYLAQTGCQRAQGFYLSRPIPQDEFLSLLNDED
jgi:EAL domain-containing protein (putative c-di-GMP-specific phosphodiesterase class I)